jgi:DNA polymerase-3 subunit alpha
LHHRDGDRANGEHENLELLCPSCHKKEEYTKGRRRRGEKGYPVHTEQIVSIESIGEHETYNVAMMPPDHNFCVNQVLTGNSFNNAHAAAYGLVLAYQTAYLKSHYPLEYMKALINSESGKSDKESGYNFKVGEYVEEARCMGLTVLPPCVTRSAGLCRTVPAKNAIRFGLEMIKGVSGGAAEWIQKQCRDASGLVDFALKCFEVVKDEQRDRHTVRARVSKSDIEGLVHAGAMDIFNPDRCKLLALAPKVMELAKKYHTQQAKLLDGSTRLKILPEQIEAELNALFMEDDDPAIERLRLEQLLDMERQVTGCFLSQSPFDPFRDVMREYCTTSFSEIEAGEYTMTNTIGLLKGFREITVKRGKSKGKSMAFMTFHGTGGTLEVTCFPRTWEAWSKDGIRIETNKVYLIQIERDTRGDSHLANNVRRLSDAGFDGSLAVA